jgi:hypothetical protein
MTQCRCGRVHPAPMYLSPSQPWRPLPQTTVAKPAQFPRYVIPKSHLLDPAYARVANRNWPFPRRPWPFESESRAKGTGLITHSRKRPPALPPCKPLFWPTGNRGC